MRLVTACVSAVAYREGVSHLVELFYSEHCLSCPQARDVLRQLASLRSDVIVIERNVDEEGDLDRARAYHLIATPALVIDRGSVMYGVPRLDKLAARLETSAPAFG